MKYRIGAGTYLICMSSLMIAWSQATLYTCQTLVQQQSLNSTELAYYVSGFSTFVGLAFYPLSAGRMRDLNFPGWAATVLALPFLGVILLPLMCFMSGPRWSNNFGDPPAPSGFARRCLALLLSLAAIAQVATTLPQFHKTRYLLKSKLVQAS
ncbi:DUF805 domain-containing protein [Undibacterium sp. Di27W]|uniref:DUF805 domain-containing protein n=1 Tax=Undibacterium sp. Di27W TaxID=3413036 RepID=UPI003BF31994